MARPSEDPSRALPPQRATGCSGILSRIPSRIASAVGRQSSNASGIARPGNTGGAATRAASDPNPAVLCTRPPPDRAPGSLMCLETPMHHDCLRIREGVAPPSVPGPCGHSARGQGHSASGSGPGRRNGPSRQRWGVAFRHVRQYRSGHASQGRASRRDSGDPGATHLQDSPPATKAPLPPTASKAAHVRVLPEEHGIAGLQGFSFGDEGTAPAHRGRLEAGRGNPLQEGRPGEQGGDMERERARRGNRGTQWGKGNPEIPWGFTKRRGVGLQAGWPVCAGMACLTR
jgi:hypothetical protein